MGGNTRQLPGETQEGRTHEFFGYTSVKNLAGGDETRKSFACRAVGQDPGEQPCFLSRKHDKAQEGMSQRWLPKARSIPPGREKPTRGDVSVLFSYRTEAIRRQGTIPCSGGFGQPQEGCGIRKDVRLCRRNPSLKGETPWTWPA